MDDDLETYILLLLADSNLPTGSFVASAGLESYINHGFGSSGPTPSSLTFLRDSLATYAHAALPFVSDAHRVLDSLRQELQARGEDDKQEKEKELLDKAIDTLVKLDELYDTMTLNHVARRASRAQGVALLTLYSKGFSRPPSLAAFSQPQSHDDTPGLADLLDRLKTMVRAEYTHGHLPVCWGALTGALSLTLERSQYLHLFLHARSLLSASVRLNEIGPYGSQQILLHAVRPLIAAETAQCKHLRTGILDNEDEEHPFHDATDGPANTWPLGEILAARHDLQHSRIFNS